MAGAIIARREFLERIRSRWFVIVTVLGPISWLAVSFLPAWLSARKELIRIEVVDQSRRDIGKIFIEKARIEPSVELRLVAPDTPIPSLLQKIETKELAGYLLIPEKVLDGAPASYRGDNATNIELKMKLQAFLTLAVSTVRGRDYGLNDAQVTAFFTPVFLDAQHTTGAAEAASAEATFILGLAIMIVLYMLIIVYGAAVLRSVTMEKTTRVVELIVSTTRARSLLWGKLIGVGGVGLVQLSAWVFGAWLIFTFRETIAGWFGVPAMNVTIPALSLLDVALTLAFFLLGFFFYSSIFAALGAMVSSEEEAQQAQTPVAFLLIVPALCVKVVADAPRGQVSAILTQIPFTSPVLMPMRVVLDAASPSEIAMSIALLMLSLVASMAVAGKIYRVGILMYGKRPSFTELKRWLAYK
jgi:ABC-2 type transport system permease protein